MQPVRSTKYALGVALFAAVLASASATQAEESGMKTSDTAALPIPDISLKIMAHLEATHPAVIVRPMALLQARCDLGHRPAQGASAVNHDMRDKDR